MRALICILVLFFSFSTVNAQLTINGKISTIPTTYVNTNGKVGTGEGLEASGKKTKTFVCPKTPKPLPSIFKIKKIN